MLFSSIFVARISPASPGNVSALAGGVIQSVGSVEVPGAVMQQTSAPQISALKLIQMSNVGALDRTAATPGTPGTPGWLWDAWGEKGWWLEPEEGPEVMAGFLYSDLSHGGFF